LVKLDHYVEDAEAQGSDVRCGLWHLRGNFLTGNVSVNVFHHVERRADHLEVFAQAHGDRYVAEHWPQRPLNAVFPRYVMRADRLLAAWRSAQDQVFIGESQQIGQIRGATGELVNLR
jgi:hypothetical protein